MTWTATENDILPGDSQKLSIRKGNLCGPGGLYSSDRDRLDFMVNEERTMETPSWHTVEARMCNTSEEGQPAYEITMLVSYSVRCNIEVW